MFLLNRWYNWFCNCETSSCRLTPCDHSDRHEQFACRTLLKLQATPPSVHVLILRNFTGRCVSSPGSVSCSLTHRIHSPNLFSVISCVPVCRSSVEGCLIRLAFCSTRRNDPKHSFYRSVGRSGFLSSKMCLHVAIVKTVGTWSSRKYPGGGKAGLWRMLP